jgi:hypothetical protein
MIGIAVASEGCSANASDRACCTSWRRRSHDAGGAGVATAPIDMLTVGLCEWFATAEAVAEDRTIWMQTFSVFASIALIAFGLGARTWAKSDPDPRATHPGDQPCEKR